MNRSQIPADLGVGGSFRPCKGNPRKIYYTATKIS